MRRGLLPGAPDAAGLLRGRLARAGRGVRASAAPRDAWREPGRKPAGGLFSDSPPGDHGSMATMDLDELRLLRRARDRMDREYAQPLDVPALARTALMSAGHFSRQFRAAYGETPYSYLMTRRIERATALLRRGDISVTDACFAVGCTSLGSFSARFTQIVGETPSLPRPRPQRPRGRPRLPSHGGNPPPQNGRRPGEQRCRRRRVCRPGRR
jgi:AraC-like DNA-binding protein